MTTCIITVTVKAGALPEIKALVLPDVLHYPNDLQRQHVLPKICGGGKEKRELGKQRGERYLLSRSLINV